MRSRFVIVLMALVMVASAAIAQQTTPSGAKVYIDQTTFDFGYVPGGATVSHSFFMRSVGTDSLKILKVQPG